MTALLSTLTSLLSLLPEAHGPALRAAVRLPRCALPVAVDREEPPRPPAPPTVAGFGQAEVPKEQQPTYELSELRNEPFFRWAEQDGFQKRLASVWLPATLFVSLPIALSTYDAQQLPAVLLAANVGGSAVVVAFCLRLRAGFGYVSERLTSKETYYEDNGASGRGGFLAEKDPEAVR